MATAVNRKMADRIAIAIVVVRDACSRRGRRAVTDINSSRWGTQGSLSAPRETIPRWGQVTVTPYDQTTPVQSVDNPQLRPAGKSGRNLKGPRTTPTSTASGA